MYQDKNSLEIFFKTFLEKEGSSLKTQKNYVTDLRDFFMFLEKTRFSNGISGSNLSLITTDDIELFRKYLIGSQKSEATIQRRISSLRTFFHACENARLINHFPFPKQKDPNLTHPLIHIWRSHLKDNGLPIEMSDHVQDFLLWIDERDRP